MTEKYTVQEFLLTHGSWQSMMQRCVYKGNRKDAAIYKHIKVCERWLRFENFIEDMGPRPGREFSLDRFPNKAGDYALGNCRWATATQQARNTKSVVLLTHAGETLPLAAWAKKTGLSRETISNRLRAGWTLADALSAVAGAQRHEQTSFAHGRLAGKKLTNVQVASMVAKARTGKVTATALGKEYGVTHTAVCHVLRQFDVKLKQGRPAA